MKGKNGNDRSTLRRRAEAKLAVAGESLAGNERDPVALVHELRVHQIELEMQNEELLRSQEEAEEQRRRFQDLYDFAPVGYLTLNAAGMVTEANLAAASLLGCERQKLVGRPLFYFLAPESRDEYDHFLRRLLAGGAGVRCEVRLGANTKRQSWLLLEGGSHLDEAARQTGRMALIDITERKAAEEALRKSEIRFSRIFHAASVLIGIITLDEERFVDINETAVETLGYRRDEIVGRTVQELGLWVDQGERSRLMGIVTEKGSVRNFEMRFRDKSGRMHVGLMSADLIDLEDVRYLLGVVRDITDWKEAQEEVEKLNTELASRATMLEASNRDLEAFGYTITHDLRRPLTRIFTAGQLLMEMCGHASADCPEIIGIVNNGCRDMDAMINAIFDLSRAKSVPLKNRTADLGSIARNIVAELQLAEPARKVRFVVSGDTTAECDPELMKIVLGNLLGNAWKYTSKRDEAEIGFCRSEREGVKEFFVRDNGIGFADEDAESLFLPFRRTAEEAEFKGHGVGLATVLRIVERHGGSVRAEGRPGKGATFFFTLPVLQKGVREGRS